MNKKLIISLYNASFGRPMTGTGMRTGQVVIGSVLLYNMGSTCWLDILMSKIPPYKP